MHAGENMAIEFESSEFVQVSNKSSYVDGLFQELNFFPLSIEE